VSAVVAPSVNSIDMGNRRPVQFVVAFLVAVGFHLRLGIHTISAVTERRFADFAGVPYQNPHNRQQWEELWEMEAEP
jgi:phosphatidylserine synthase